MNNTFQNTNYYNDINAAYNAGVSKDTGTRDNLIKNLNNALSDSCEKYTKNPNVVKKVNSEGEVTDVEFDLEASIGKYKNNIEFSNSVREQLIQDEEEYFVTKYGSIVYEYLLRQRALYNQEMSDANTQSSCSSVSGTSNGPNTGVDGDNNYPDTTPGSGTTSSSAFGTYDSEGNFIDSPSLCNDTGLSFYNRFSKYLSIPQSDVINRKIDYRETEHEFLMKINSLLNWIYYSLFALMIILLIGGKNVEIQSRAPIYIFLALLPLLYPYFFKILFSIYNYFTITPNIHGPKNAFLDINGETNIVDAYDN